MLRRRARQISIGLLTLSGLIHISGLFTSWIYDRQAGIIMLVVSILGLASDYFQNNGSFSGKGTLIIYKKEFKWSVLRNGFGLMFLVVLLVFRVLPVSILVTLIAGILLTLADYRQTLEISGKYIADRDIKISFDNIRSIDFRQHEVVLTTEPDLIKSPLGYLKIDLSDFDQQNRELLINRLKGVK